MQDIEAIFDFSEAFESLRTEDERHEALVRHILKKVRQLTNSGQSFPEKESHELFALKGSLSTHPLVRYRYGEVLLEVGEANAALDALSEIDIMGALVHPVSFLKAVVLIRLEKLQEALDILQAMIGTGWRNYDLFMLAATVKAQSSDLRGAISMANLAVYENKDEQPEPFVLMAFCFEKNGEKNRMLECFSRVEKMVGSKGLEQHLGKLLESYGEMYRQVKGMMDS